MGGRGADFSGGGGSAISVTYRDVRGRIRTKRFRTRNAEYNKWMRGFNRSGRKLVSIVLGNGK